MSKKEMPDGFYSVAIKHGDYARMPDGNVVQLIDPNQETEHERQKRLKNRSNVKPFAGFDLSRCDTTPQLRKDQGE